MNNNNGSGFSKNNSNSSIEKYLFAGTKSFKDYWILIRNNIKVILIISAVILLLAAVYAFITKSVYSSTVAVRISNPYKNVLEGNNRNPDNTYLDRYIISEMGVINNSSTRGSVAVALVDTFKLSPYKNQLPLISSGKGSTSPKSIDQIIGLLAGTISIEQNQGTDVVLISAESGSPFEAALIANITAIEYQKINTLKSREKLTNIRKFLEQRSEEKRAELRAVEDSLTRFLEKGGIVSMDVQSSGLIGQLSSLDAQKEATKIELLTSNEILKQYKFFLGKQDPQLVEYLEGQTSQAYINALQQQIAELQVNRDIALTVKSTNVDVSAKVQDYDQRIAELRQKLSSAIATIKTQAFAGNPEQVSDLAQRLIEEEIRNSTLSVQLEQLESVTGKYEGELRRLPKSSTILTQYQRDRESLQQMYLTLNEKYQEALINELSESGNVQIISPAVVPNKPSKPNRLFIILVGLILGPVISFALILIRDHFDDSVKTPDDIEKENIRFLTWVPHYKSVSKTDTTNLGLIVLEEQDSPISESFRAIKARIQQSSESAETPKVILVTSPAESEGKSFVSSNLAASFAQSNKKALLIDCDLRRPTVHSTMAVDKKPGVSDYLLRKVKLEEIIRKTRNSNLNFITSGTLPSNPAEVLESKQFKNFLMELQDFFDVIILDTPPIVAVIDAEILAKQAKGALLVLSADKTENRLMKDAVELLERNNVNFFGTVLNNFKYKSGYGYYYKYYYNYSKSSNSRGKRNF